MQEEKDEIGPVAAREEEPAAAGSRPGFREEAHVVEPENALPEVTLEGLPESMRAACARAG